MKCQNLLSSYHVRHQFNILRQWWYFGLDQFFMSKSFQFRFKSLWASILLTHIIIIRIKRRERKRRFKFIGKIWTNYRFVSRRSQVSLYNHTKRNVNWNAKRALVYSWYEKWLMPINGVRMLIVCTQSERKIKHSYKSNENLLNTLNLELDSELV